MRITRVLSPRAFAVEDESDVELGMVLGDEKRRPFARVVGIRQHRQRADWTVVELSNNAPNLYRGLELGQRRAGSVQP